MVKHFLFYSVLIIIAASLAGCDLTDSFNVGYKRFELTDSSRDELLTDDPLDKRTIVVQVFYPTEEAEAILPDDSKDRPYESCTDGGLIPMWEEMMSGNMNCASVLLDSSRVLANEGVALSGRLPKYPVLLYSPGLGATHNMNTTLVRSLVKRGYVVAAIGHTYINSVVRINGNDIYMPILDISDPAILHSARQIGADDAKFVIDTLAALNSGEFDGKLYLDKVGYFGHSIGGSIASLALRQDDRVAAAINMDGLNHTDVVENGLDKPWFYMLSDSSIVLDEAEAIWATVPHGNMFVMASATHIDYTDLCHPCIARPTLQIAGVCGSVNKTKMDEIVGEYANAFFRKYMLGTDEPLLDAPAYPELIEFWSK